MLKVKTELKIAGPRQASCSGEHDMIQNHRNYQRELDRILNELGSREISDNPTPETALRESGVPARQNVLHTAGTPSLLLHSCCAPCSSYVLEYLSRYFRITVLYYNPNIYPEEEYFRRTEEQQRLIREMPLPNPVQFLEGRFEPAEFYTAIRGLEHIPEGGDRCRACFRLRLDEAARIASERGFDYFTTTLTISPLKNAAALNEIGEALADEYGVRWLPSDFKKKNGYKRSIELSAEYDLYRQDYCGCVFSKREREHQKADQAISPSHADTSSPRDSAHRTAT